MRRDAEQFGGAPHQVRLELVQHAVSQNDLPQHLDDALTAVLVEPAAQYAGETIEVDRVMLPGFRLFQRPAQLIVVDGEARLQQSLERLGFFGIDMAVDHRGVNEKRRRGEPELILAKIARALVLTENVIDESLYFAPNGHAQIPPLELGRE